MTNSRDFIRDAVFNNQVSTIENEIENLNKIVPSTYLEEVQIQDRLVQLRNVLRYMQEKNDDKPKSFVVDTMPVHGRHAQPR